MQIIIASKNPVKIQAVQTGFQQVFPEAGIEILPVTVNSGVSDQPMTDEETYRGAFNRAGNAREQYPDADYHVGIEGGISVSGENTETFAWIVIMSEKVTGRARTTTFQLPSRVIKLIEKGYELGDANDLVFKKHNSKQKNGAVGLLTNDIVTRTDLYVQAVVLALIPFLNQELF